MLNTIRGEVLNISNPEHLKIIMHLKHESKSLLNKKYLKSRCVGFGMKKEWEEFDNYCIEKKKQENSMNKKKIKSDIDETRQDLILLIMNRIKIQVELGSVSVNKDWIDYRKCTKEETQKKATKKLR